MKKTILLLILVAIVLVVAVIAARRRAFAQGFKDAAPNAQGMSVQRGHSFLNFITDEAYRNGRLSYQQLTTVPQ